MNANSNQPKTEKVRVRIPPSPTGFMHIGTLRAALFNYLFVRQKGGEVILRLEDTDRERSKTEYADDILDGLKWAGIEWDEGPFYQSRRTEIYRRYLQKLIDENKAYYCFCTPDELEARRQYQMSRGEAPIYSGACADILPQRARERAEKGEKSAIRFRAAKKKIKFNDLVRGEIEFDAALIGDFLIAKNFTSPLYNFTVVVDDFEMNITHVIRGEDHISNTPRQILIQEALGFFRPVYAHLPMIMGADRSKLSKRHGAVAVTDYRRQGYLPEALVNFTAFLGWNPGTEKEIYSMEELMKDFSLDKVQKGGAVFNPARLDYLNNIYIKKYDTGALAKLCLPHFIAAGFLSEEESGEKIFYKNPRTGERVDFEFIKKIVAYQQPRLKKLAEIAEVSDYFFLNDLRYEKDLLKWKDALAAETKLALDKIKNIFSKIETGDWSLKNLEEAVLPQVAEFNLSIGKPQKDRGYLLWPLRVALCGKKMSIGPFEMADVLGKEKSLARIAAAIAMLNGSICLPNLFNQ